VAVLFADICNSTLLYQRLGDTAAQAVVDACLTQVREVAQQHSGRVVKTIGDAALCAFQTADDAVLAASSMQAKVQASRPGRQPVKLHIGLPRTRYSPPRRPRRGCRRR
jgi:class 3 adenylate cyclase